MAAMEDWLENAFLDHVLRGVAMPLPAAWFIALYSSPTTDAGGGTELAGGGYARQALVANAANAGQAANGVEIRFEATSGPWNQATHWGLLDAPAGGTRWLHGALAAPKVIDVGYPGVFAPGDLLISAD